jgi:hypothetical protein
MLLSEGLGSGAFGLLRRSDLKNLRLTSHLCSSIPEPILFRHNVVASYATSHDQLSQHGRLRHYVKEIVYDTRKFPAAGTHWGRTSFGGKAKSSPKHTFCIWPELIRLLQRKLYLRKVALGSERITKAAPSSPHSQKKNPQTPAGAKA